MSRMFSLMMILLVSFSTLAQSGGTIVITKSVVASGGGRAAGGVYSLESTIGQSLAGADSSGGVFKLGGGFWGGGLAPAAAVSVSGRVTTPSGLGLRNAVIALTDSQGFRRTALTSSFGIYTFENIPAGETYTISVSSKRYRFSPQTLLINENLVNLDFSGLE